MQLSPLQLLEYAFEAISVTPETGYADKDRNPSFVLPPSVLNIAAESGISLIAEKPEYSDYGLKLVLSVKPKEPGGAPYSATVAVQGAVRMHQTADTRDMKDREQRALVNGISLLYGLVRDMVCNITSRAIHGQLLLPTLNFSDLANRKPNESIPGSVAALEATKSRTRKKSSVVEAKAKA